jgi:hypothetical protein
MYLSLHRPWLRRRLTTRRLGLLVLMVALGLGGWRVYREGPELHWLVFKLRYGGVETRLSTASKILRAVASQSLWTIQEKEPIPGDPRGRQAWLALRQQRDEILFSALLSAIRDPVPECRGAALRAAGKFVLSRPSDSRKNQVRKETLVALRDPNAVVRSAGLEQLVGIEQPPIALASLRKALADPSVEVQVTAIWQLGVLGMIAAETQAEIVAILKEILNNQQDDRVRVAAEWGLSHFENANHDDTPGPNVVPALLIALRDPEVGARREAATILARMTSTARSQSVAAWSLRREVIIPACRTAMTDTDEETRNSAALALFALGVRDPEIAVLLKATRHGRDANGTSLYHCTD